MKCVEAVIEKICKSIEKQLDSDGSNAEVREDVKTLAALVAASENVTAYSTCSSGRGMVFPLPM